MIKKSVFENDLIAGMQRELQPFEKTAAVNDLVKAADYLNSTIEIFEEVGLTAQADQVLAILEKIANKPDSKVRSMLSLETLLDGGLSISDLKNIKDPISRARVNSVMRRLGYSDKEIKDFLGDKFMSKEEAADLLSPERSFQQINEWFNNPHQPISPEDVQDRKPEIFMKSILNPALPKAENISFASDENDARRPKDPTKVSDSHTKGLTPEKMVANLEGNGTVFNMADDGFADDLLDLDLNEAAVELTGGDLEDKRFEDTD